jgi:pyridoxamine 5'-phosphate oxidase
VNRDPFRQFSLWWRDEQVPAVVATASRDGRPSARAVVLERFDERGFVFWSSAESRKGRELAANPRAALVFVWGARQARVEGTVEPVSDAENEEHWAGREAKRPIAAFRQDEPIGSREELEALVEQTPTDPPRPAFWVGYRVVPELFDFWEADDGFVHDRCGYLPADGGGWTVTRLQP